MTEVTVHEAKSHLSQLIQQVINGEEVVISSRNKPKIKLILAEPAATPRKVGLGKGSVLFMAEDFNETPEEFREDTA